MVHIANANANESSIMLFNFSVAFDSWLLLSGNIFSPLDFCYRLNCVPLKLTC
jgi:hypothetical protein